MLALVLCAALGWAADPKLLNPSEWRVEEAFEDSEGNQLLHLRKGDLAVREAWYPYEEVGANLYSLMSLRRERSDDGLSYDFRAPTERNWQREGRVAPNGRGLRVTCGERSCTFRRLGVRRLATWNNHFRDNEVRFYDVPEVRSLHAVLKVPNVDEYYVVDSPRFKITGASFVHAGESGQLKPLKVTKWGGTRGGAALDLEDGRRLWIDLPHGTATITDREELVKLIVKPFELDEVKELGLDVRPFQAKRVRTPASGAFTCAVFL